MNSPQKQPETDQDLAKRIMQGDPQAFEQCYRTYRPVVQRYLASRNGHFDLDDLVQEVFTRFWEHGRRFCGNAAISTYLIGIAGHVLSEHERHRNRQVPLQREQSPEQLQTHRCSLPAPDAHVDRNEALSAVRAAMAQLTTDQRSAVENLYFDKPSQGDTSLPAQPESSVVRKRLYRAVDALRRILKPGATARDEDI
jgi:RNA polymerase sigma-70 factor (ECF subfamily)